MAQISGIDVEEFDIKVVSPASLRMTDNAGVSNLLYRSVRRDFPERTTAELDYFLRDSEVRRSNPNKGMSGIKASFWTRKSTYKDQRAVVAKLDGRVVAIWLLQTTYLAGCQGP